MKLFTSFFKWSVDVHHLKDVKKSVIIQAPHTSNWDFILGIIAAKKIGLKFKFIIKDSWNKPIIGDLLNYLGAIFIDRSKSTGLTQNIAKELKKIDVGHIIFTPEGTRSNVTKWKSGFYHVAYNAQIPISVGYIDYKEKKIGIASVFYPTGEMSKDLEDVRRFYSKVNAKHPNNYHSDWAI